MLILHYPMLKRQLSQFPLGMWPARLPNRNTPVLFAKLPREFALTAVERRFLKLYFVPISICNVRLIGVITAFSDDADEPLCLRTLLFEDELSSHLLENLLQPAVEIYFFDEHDRELASFEATVVDPQNMRKQIQASDRSEPDQNVLAAAYETILHWFSQRNAEADARAFHVDLVKELFPSDIDTINLDARQSGYAGANLVSYYSLVQNNAGQFQEPDIIQLLQRVFADKQLFMNPMRADKPDKEFADALVVTPTHVIIVQAKNSPNTPKMLDRQLARKRATGHGQLVAGKHQLQGATGYCRSSDVLRVLADGNLYELTVVGKKILGILVVRELFPDETDRQLAVIDQVRTKTGVDVIVLDYPGLSVLTFHSQNEAAFLDAFYALSAEAKAGRYPEINNFILKRYVPGQQPAKPIV